MQFDGLYFYYYYYYYYFTILRPSGHPHEPEARWLVPRFGIPSHNYCTVLYCIATKQDDMYTSLDVLGSWDTRERVNLRFVLQRQQYQSAMFASHDHHGSQGWTRLAA